MSASYSLFKTHCGASGVEQSTTGNFTSPTDINLIVAKNNIIEIYKLPDDTIDPNNTKLLLISRYTLFGEVQDIKTARFVPNHTDSLLITFPDAKLSIIDFDASSRTIITTALFNFDLLYRRIGNITSSYDLKIRIDPLQRCAAIQLSHDLLFILPLFNNYLKLHKQRKGSNPINIIYTDTLANEYQQEIEAEEQRLNADLNHNNPIRNGNHNRRDGNHNNKYISPLPPRDDNNMQNDNEEEEVEDIEYIQSMKGDKNNKEFDDDGEWDTAYRKNEYYQYHSLCSKHYFIINLRVKCQKIVDFIFLDGYNTPQILMLFEKTGTWGGRVPVRNKTISLLSITLNVVRKSYNIPFILKDILSYDFNKLYPIKSSSNMLHSSIILQQVHTNKNKYIQTNIGGAFLIGSNAILHFGQNIDFGLSFNQHGDILSKDFVLLRKWTERVINLECCNITALDNKGNNDFLISDGNGFMYLLSIQSGKMNLCTLGIGPIPTTMIQFTNNNNKFVFIGSRLADSLLLCHNIRKQKQKVSDDSGNNDVKETEISELNDQLFGDINDENKNNKKRTFSEMDVDNDANNNNDDLAMNLFGVTTETLAAAAENNMDPSKTGGLEHSQSGYQTDTPEKQQPLRLKHLSLYGPKVKRRKLSGKKELQIHELQFMNLVDFEEDKLFELEIEKENRSRPVSSFMEENIEQNTQDQEEEMLLKEYARLEQILREKYEFRICDKMTNLSPITSVVMSKSYDPRFLHCDYVNLMASTGFGTQAKLSIVQEGIRPQILAKTNSNKIISAVNCWTLFETVETSTAKKPENSCSRVMHKYLIATDLQQTQVIDVSDTITPMILNNSNSIKLDVRSILCGHIGKCNYIVQIYEHGIRLLNNLNLIHECKMEEQRIVDAYICDPYVLLHLNDKSIRLCVFSEEKKEFAMEKVEDLKRYKQISDTETERRKSEYVLRRCNKMTWEQYTQLEQCINNYLSVIDENNNEKDINGLILYIDEILINPISDENDNENAKEEKKTNSMKEELSDSDGDVQIELADHLKQQIMTSTTGWQSSDWRENNSKKKKKTLFNLGLNIDIILKRLYGKQDDIFHRLPKDILQEQISKDLDCGVIEKCYLYKYNAIKIRSLKELNNNWNEEIKELKQHNAETYQQLLSTSYQTKRLDIKALKTLKKNRKRRMDSEEKLLTGLFFGDGQEDENNEEEEEDNDIKMNGVEDSIGESHDQVCMIVARSSGVLQIFSVPEFILVFECSEIHIGHGLLCNNLVHDESLGIILSKHQLTKRKNLKDYIHTERETKISNNCSYFEDELIPQQLKDELWCSSTNIYIDDDGTFENEFEHRLVEDLFVHVLNGHPYLLIILSNGDLLIYEMFEYFIGGTELKSSIGRHINENSVSDMKILPIRLNRFKHNLFTRKKFTFDEIQNAEINKIKKKIYSMNNVNGLSGVIISVAGNNPIIILSHRGCPIIHNLSISDDIRGFASFENNKISIVAQDNKITNGYIYFNEYGMVIGTIPTHMHNIACRTDDFKDIEDIGKEEKEKEQKNKEEEEKEEKTQKEEEEDEQQQMDIEMEMDMDEIFGHSFVLQKQRMNNLLEYISIDYSSIEYPICHIPLSETLHFIIKHPLSGTYLLIMSRYKYIAGTEMLQSRDIRPIETYFECRLLNPYKWRYDDRLTGFIIHQSSDINNIGGGSAEENENDENSIPISEHILCAKSVNIQETSRIGSQTIVNKNLIILGTGTNQGEDNASIGRIVMLEIIPEKENKKFSTNITDSNERFYIQTKQNSDCNLLNKSIHEISLENENMTHIYENTNNNKQKEYYKKELQYYKKCMEQDKINNIRYRIHYVFARRERAAVTALNCVNGLIVAAIGPKLLLFRWDGTQLIGCAFLDTRIHCHSILVLKNFVLTGDLFQGLDLYHWEQDIASIVKLARDVQYRSIYSVNWRIYNQIQLEQQQQQQQLQQQQQKKKEFDFLVSDMSQNLHIISYQPHLFSRFGFLSKMDKEKLYTKCLFHIGTNISQSIILKFKNQKNYFNLSVCIDGSINYLIPINEQIYRRLSSLHSQMIFYCKHNCGLNPREYRYANANQMHNKNNSGRKFHIMYNHSPLNSIHGCDRSNTLTSKNIIDHDLVKQFVNLDYRTQNKLTTNIGVRNANVIVNHLKQLYNNTKWF